MIVMLAASVEYGGYVSWLKLLIVLAAFFGWLPLVNWIYLDSRAVETNTFLWTLVAALVGAAALFMWLMIPTFFIGLLIFLVALGGSLMAYVTHRNSLVNDYDKVLTPEHIKNIFVNPQKKLQQLSRGLSFITANKNEVPLPEPKSREASGFAVTCDLLDDAIWRRVSQILLNPQKEEYEVIYIIDGVPGKQPSRPKEEVEDFIYYGKQLASLEVEERRKPQKGRFTAILNQDQSQRYQWELITSGSTAGEQVKVKRIEEHGVWKIEDLGFNENQIESILALRKETAGIVLISGTANSGLTSTLYALLRNHDPFLYNINTLEKKPAGELQNITQTLYTMSDTGTTTFSKRLQSLLRRGPDIVGIGICDDSQTAKLAAAGAKDGKLLYVVLEADSVNQTIEKWIKLVGDQGLVSETLKCIINQRLVRKLCNDCRVAYKPNQALFRKFNIPANEVETFYRPGEIEYDKHGKPIICEHCQGTGYFGRTGLYETICINDELKQVIKNAKSVNEIGSEFRKAGMLYMQEQSIKKVALGITSINEVIRNFSKKEA